MLLFWGLSFEEVNFALVKGLQALRRKSHFGTNFQAQKIFYVEILKKKNQPNCPSLIFVKNARKGEGS